MEEAHDLFASAANQFRLEKKWKESGDAFCEAGECSVKAGEEDDAANDYWSAGRAYKKSDPEREPIVALSLVYGRETNAPRVRETVAVAALRKTIEIYIKKGRFRQAADRSKEIGQIFQQDGGDLQGALEAYDQAGEWYSQEDAAACAPAPVRPGY